MLSDKLLQKSKTPVSSDTPDEVYQPKSYECTPLDRTFALGCVLVSIIVCTTLYFALYYKPY